MRRQSNCSSEDEVHSLEERYSSYRQQLPIKENTSKEQLFGKNQTLPSSQFISHLRLRDLVPSVFTFPSFTEFLFNWLFPLRK